MKKTHPKQKDDCQIKAEFFYHDKLSILGQWMHLFKMNGIK